MTLILALPMIAVIVVMMMVNRAVKLKDPDYAPEDLRTKPSRCVGISMLCLGIYATLIWIAIAVFLRYDGQKSLCVICAAFSPLGAAVGVFLYFTFTKQCEWIEGDRLYYKRLLGGVKEIPLEDIDCFSYNPHKTLAMILFDSEKRSLLMIPANRLGRAMLARELEARGKTRIDSTMMVGTAKDTPKVLFACGIMLLATGLLFTVVAACIMGFSKAPAFENEKVVGQLREFRDDQPLTFRLKDNENVYAVKGYVRSTFDDSVLDTLKKGDEIVLYTAYKEAGRIYIAGFERDGVVFLSVDDTRRIEEKQTKTDIIIGIIMMIFSFAVAAGGLVLTVKNRKKMKAQASDGAKRST